MGCRIRIVKGAITYRLYWLGVESQEGTGLAATTRNLEVHQRAARKIDAMMRAGKFTEADYRHYFAFGSRRQILGLPAWHRRRDRRIGQMTVREYGARWLEVVAPPAISKNLHDNHRASLRAWAYPLIGDVRLCDVNLLVLQGWQTKLFAKGLALASVRHAMTSTFKAMWKHARISAKAETALGDPFEGLSWPKPIREAPDPIPADEENEILARFREKRANYYPLIAALFWTGARPSELTGLCWRHFDPRSGKLSIVQSRVMGVVGPTKTRTSRRTIPLAPALVELIRGAMPLHPDPDAPIFLNPRGNPVETRAFSKWIWGPTLRALGHKARRLYTTRHTYISKALTAGANPKHVAEYVGTSLVKIQDHYGRYMGATDVDPLTAAVERNPDISGIRQATGTTTTRES